MAMHNVGGAVRRQRIQGYYHGLGEEGAFISYGAKLALMHSNDMHDYG